MKNLKKIIALLLALIFVTSALASCTVDEEEPVASDTVAAEAVESENQGETETTEVTEPPLVLVADGKTDYTIWVSKTQYSTNSTLRESIGKLLSDIKLKTGVQMTVQTDDKYTANDADKPAILIGDTVFAESKEFANEDMNPKDFKLVRRGNKILVYAVHADGSSDGVKYLQSKVFVSQGADKTLKFEKKHEHIQTTVVPIKKITVLGVDLKDYVIVIPKEATLDEKLVAYLFRNYIKENYTQVLTVNTDDKTPVDNEILVGKTNRTTITAKTNSYTVTASGTKLQMIADGMLGHENLSEYLSKTLFKSGRNAKYDVAEGFTYEGELKTVLDDGTYFVTNRTGDARIMLYNIYGYSDSLAIADRQHYQIEMLKAYKPDVFGAQEFSPAYQTEMTNKLRDIGYTRVMTDSEESNFTPLFYNAETLKLIDCGYKLYPQKMEGDTAGSELNINDINSKSRTWAVFETKVGSNAGKKFAVISTHFMYSAKDLTADQANKARCIDAKELLKTIAEIQSFYQNIPVISGGDFNCNIKSDPYKILLNGGDEKDGIILANGVKTAKNEAEISNNSSGHHGYAKPDRDNNVPVTETPSGTFDASIDHIVVTPNTNVLTFGTLINEYSLYSSDHSPVMTEISLG